MTRETATRLCIAITVLAMVLIVLACGASPSASSLPASAISREDAILIAQSHLPSAEVSLVSAKLGQLADFAPTSVPSLPRDTPVWAIVFAGTFPGECVAAASGEQCPSAFSSVLVVLDAAQGVFVKAEYPAP